MLFADLTCVRITSIDKRHTTNKWQPLVISSTKRSVGRLAGTDARDQGNDNHWNRQDFLSCSPPPSCFSLPSSRRNIIDQCFTTTFRFISDFVQRGQWSIDHRLVAEMCGTAFDRKWTAALFYGWQGKDHWMLSISKLSYWVGILRSTCIIFVVLLRLSCDQTHTSSGYVCFSFPDKGIGA